MKYSLLMSEHYSILDIGMHPTLSKYTTTKYLFCSLPFVSHMRACTVVATPGLVQWTCYTDHRPEREYLRGYTSDCMSLHFCAPGPLHPLQTHYAPWRLVEEAHTKDVCQSLHQSADGTNVWCETPHRNFIHHCQYFCL